MFAQFCRDPQLGSRCDAILTSIGSTRATDCWATFVRAVPLAACSIVAVPQLARSELFHPLATLRIRLPYLPLVLVADDESVTTGLAARLPVEEVVAVSEIDQSLRSAALRARAHGLLPRLARAFDEADNLNRKLRHALAHACRVAVPVRTIDQLAAAIGCSRGTLWYHWRRAFESEPPLRLEDMLDWLLLLRAAGHKLPGRGWSMVAADLGVHQVTLRRVAQRLTGLRLSAVAAAGQTGITQRFSDAVLRPMLRESETEVLW